MSLVSLYLLFAEFVRLVYKVCYFYQSHYLRIPLCKGKKAEKGGVSAAKKANSNSIKTRNWKIAVFIKTQVLRGEKRERIDSKLEKWIWLSRSNWIKK